MVPGSACRYHPCLFVHVILTISSIFDSFTHKGRGLITSAPYFLVYPVLKYNNRVHIIMNMYPKPVNLYHILAPWTDIDFGFKLLNRYYTLVLGFWTDIYTFRILGKCGGGTLCPPPKKSWSILVSSSGSGSVLSCIKPYRDKKNPRHSVQLCRGSRLLFIALPAVPHIVLRQSLPPSKLVGEGHPIYGHHALGSDQYPSYSSYLIFWLPGSLDPGLNFYWLWLVFPACKSV